MSTMTNGNLGTHTFMINMGVDDSSLKSSTQKIQQTLETASAAQREAQERNAASYVTGTYGKMGTRIQELGRGFEDFTVSFSMAKTTSEGIAMGLRGAANNAAQLASSFNPIAGAVVAVGASLATIIVPQMMKWLGTMYEVNRELKDYEKLLDDIAKKEGQKTKFGIEAEEIKTLEDLQKKEVDKAKEQRVIESELAALVKEQTVAHKELARAKASEAAFAKRTIFESKTLAYTERYLAGRSGQVARAKPEVEAANKAVSDKQNELARVGREAQVLKDQLNRVSLEEDKKHEDKFNKWVAVRDNDLRKDNIKHEEEFSKHVADQKAKARSIEEKFDEESLKLKNDKRAEYERDFYKEKDKIDLLGAVSKEKRDELHAKNSANLTAKVDKLAAEETQKAAIAALDKNINEKTESIDILQERIQKAGNAAGPSAAFVTGTQAAESAINRAISGTRSVEDTMKAQLKVQQDMLKALNKQKNQLTTKAI